MCLFPGIGSVGGIQVSACEALLTFQDTPGLDVIIYGPDDCGVRATCPPTTIVSQNRLDLALRLLARRWSVQTALFWHVGLLKLLPFLRGFRGRVILFLHGIEAWRKPSWATRVLLRRVDHFLSNSQSTWERFLDFAPQFRAARHTVVHLGIGERLSEASATPCGPPAAVIIGRLARDERYSKGHRELIVAWPIVRQRIQDAQLWVVGDGPLRPELESLARSAGVAEAVRFFGQVSESEKIELIRRSRCLAMPSRGEGFGLVYLEAMRLGRPCLVSNCDAGREVINPPEGGLAVAPHNPDEIARAVCELLTTDSRWQQRSQAARSRFEDCFTAGHFRERLRRAVLNG